MGLPPASRPVWILPAVVAAALVFLLLFQLLGTVGYLLWLELDLHQALLAEACLLVMTTVTVTGWILGHTMNNAFVRAYTRLAWVLTGAFFYTLLLSLALTALFISFTLLQPGLVDAWGLPVVVAAAGIVISVTVWGMVLARRIHPVRLHVRTPRLRGKHLRLAVISDLHIGTVIGGGYLEKVTRLVRAQRADMLLCVGDILDMNPELLEMYRPQFRELFAVCKSFAVSGNHEYISGVRRSAAFLEGCGAEVIRDSTRVQDGLTLVGLDDTLGTSGGGPRREVLEKLLDAVDNDGPVVVLAHQPRDIDIVARSGAELMLCGHTHGGQLWPFGLLLKAMFRKYWQGGTMEDGTLIYTGNGTGTWGPPMRIGAPPQLIVVDLIRGSKELHK